MQYSTLHNSTNDKKRVISSNISRENIIIESFNYIKWLFQNLPLIKVIVSIELQKNILRTKLSYLWWLLDPFFNFLCYLFLVMVMNRGAGFKVPFALYILSALIPWHFTMKSITGGSKIWNSYKALIGQVRFPYLILPIAVFITESVLFFMSTIVLLVVGLIYGYYPNWNWFFLPFVFIPHIIMIMAIMLFSTQISFKFYDWDKLFPFILRIWFFVSPAIWTLEMLPEKFQTLIYFNPMTLIYINYRKCLLYNEVPDFKLLFYHLIISSIFLFIAVIIFIRKEQNINRYI